jgi:hypothetical protein
MSTSPTHTTIEMWRPGASQWALRGRLGVVAATVIDGEKASSCAKNGSPVSVQPASAVLAPPGPTRIAKLIRLLTTTTTMAQASTPSWSTNALRPIIQRSSLCTSPAHA